MGDAAHQVSPFGARGANSGIQDTDNLIWKLKLVMQEKAPIDLLDSYSSERVVAARENLLNSTRTTDFMSPKSGISKVFRNSVLELAHDYEFAQGLTNSGRLSDPAIQFDSLLNTPDTTSFSGELVPGAVVSDAPVQGPDGVKWLLSVLESHFHLLYFADDPKQIPTETLAKMSELEQKTVPIHPVIITGTASYFSQIDICLDTDGMVKERFDGQTGTSYLIRPDQHVVARWRSFDIKKVSQALARAIANKGEG